MRLFHKGGKWYQNMPLDWLNAYVWCWYNKVLMLYIYWHG